MTDMTPDEMRKELGECPFCEDGGDPIYSDPMSDHVVICADCGAEGPIKPTRESAAEAWNRVSTIADHTLSEVRRLSAENERLRTDLDNQDDKYQALRVEIVRLRKAQHPNNGPYCNDCGHPLDELDDNRGYDCPLCALREENERLHKALEDEHPPVKNPEDCKPSGRRYKSVEEMLRYQDVSQEIRDELEHQQEGGQQG